MLYMLGPATASVCKLSAACISTYTLLLLSTTTCAKPGSATFLGDRFAQPTVLNRLALMLADIQTASLLERLCSILGSQPFLLWKSVVASEVAGV